MKKEINKINEYLNETESVNMQVIEIAFERNVLLHIEDEKFFDMYLYILEKKYGKVFSGTIDERLDFVNEHLKSK